MTRITERVEIAVDDVLTPHAVPGVALVRTKPEVGPGTPGCWFGGRPTLPAHIPWPMNDEFDPPMPMHFLCRLDLARYPVAVMEAFDALPRAGTLFFFYDAVYGGVFTELWDASAVIYVEESLEGVPERDPPPMPPVEESCTSDSYLEKGGNEFPRWPITLYEVATYPVDWWNRCLEDELSSETYLNAHHEWHDNLIDRFDTLHNSDKSKWAHHPPHVAMGAYGASKTLGKTRLLYIGDDPEFVCPDGYTKFHIEHEAFKECDFTKAQAYYDGWYIG